MITSTKGASKFFRFSMTKDGKEIGRASLFLIVNDLHTNPYGLMEDVWLDENHRGKGVGKELVQAIIQKTKEEKCYKLIATSRRMNEKVHALYIRLGFKFHGLEFRMDF